MRVDDTLSLVEECSEIRDTEGTLHFELGCLDRFVL